MVISNDLVDFQTKVNPNERSNNNTAADSSAEDDSDDDGEQTGDQKETHGEVSIFVFLCFSFPKKTSFFYICIQLTTFHLSINQSILKNRRKNPNTPITNSSETKPLTHLLLFTEYFYYIYISQTFQYHFTGETTIF